MGYDELGEGIADDDQANGIGHPEAPQDHRSDNCDKKEGNDDDFIGNDQVFAHGFSTCGSIGVFGLLRYRMNVWV